MIEEIRKFFGMTQKMLATYLGVTRSHLSMVELGQRFLPYGASSKLDHLYLVVHDFKSRQTEVVHQPWEWKELEDFLDFELRYRQHQLIGLKKRLNKMKADNENRYRILPCIEFLQEGADQRGASVLGYLEASTRHLLGKSGPLPMLKLEMKIQSLEAEIKFLQAEYSRNQL